MKSFLFIFFVLLFFSSCKDSVKDQAELNLEKKYIATLDSAKFAFDSVVSNEQRKFFLIRRVIEDAEYQMIAESEKISAAKAALESAQKLEYTMENIRNSDWIDSYDATSEQAVRSVFDLIFSIKEIERFPGTRQMEEEIRELHSRVLTIRVYYDDFAKSSTFLLRELKVTGGQLSTKYKDTLELPLFQLMPI